MARNRVKVNLHSPGVRELLHEDGIREELRRHAERVLQVARDNAPVKSGAYRDSIHIENATTDRAVVRVVADDEKAMLIESRTGNLARAVDAAGGGG